MMSLPINSEHNMSDPLIWAEGTQLTPQHFQYWSEYLAWQQQVSTRYPFNWGLYRLNIDKRALSQGHLIIKQFELCFAHTGYYCYSHTAATQLQFDITKYKQPSLIIVLCLAMGNQVRDIPGYPNVAHAGFSAHCIKQSDCYDMERQRAIQIAVPQWQLCALGDETDNCHSLALVKINIDAKQQYSVAEDFIPPLLTLQASNVLQQMLQSLLLLLAKTKKIISQQSMTMSTTQILLKLEIVRYNSKLTNLLLYSCHPFSLFMVWSTLLSTAATLLKQKYTIPTYQHDKLFKVFNSLYHQLDAVLSKQSHADYYELQLKQQPDGFWIGKLAQQIWWQQTLYLIMVPSMESINMDDILISQLKLAAPSVCYKLVASALSGIVLQGVDAHILPVELPASCYVFKLKLQCSDRQALVQEGSIAMFSVPTLRLKQLFILCVKESV